MLYISIIFALQTPLMPDEFVNITRDHRLAIQIKGDGHIPIAILFLSTAPQLVYSTRAGPFTRGSVEQFGDLPTPYRFDMDFCYRKGKVNFCSLHWKKYPLSSCIMIANGHTFLPLLSGNLIIIMPCWYVHAIMNMLSPIIALHVYWSDLASCFLTISSWRCRRLPRQHCETANSRCSSRDALWRQREETRQQYATLLYNIITVPSIANKPRLICTLALSLVPYIICIATCTF